MNPRLKMLFIITERGKAEEALELCAKCGALYKTASLCRGTASSEVLDLFGLGETEKVLINAIADDPVIQNMLERLKKDMELDKPGHGVAFTVPLAAVGGRQVMEFLAGREIDNGGKHGR